MTLTAVTNGPGKVTFDTRGKRIPGCVAVPVVDYSGTLKAICNMKPTTSGTMKVYASYTSNTSAYTNAQSITSDFVIGRRSGNR
jgi:hypothetical protein